MSVISFFSLNHSLANRGHGIASALMQAALQKARETSLTRAELYVRVDNTVAIEMYKKLGFEVEGLHKNATLQDGKYSDQLSMAKMLV